MNNLTELVRPYSLKDKKYLKSKERNFVRAMLRKALKQGKLESRTTYYDYYDSCHAPVVTPNAPWTLITMDQLEYWISRLKAGSASVYLLPDGTYELITGYSNYEVRIVK